MSSSLEAKEDLLIVDDTPANLRLLSSMLSDQGYKVRSVMNGATALKAALAKPPDLILLDINMPQMNGYEVCQQLKSHPETVDIPVIFLSALDDVLDKVKAFTVGGVDYITKPFQLEEVLVRIENHLSLRKAKKQLQRALEDLQKTQGQLIQKEKMAGLGQLVAGVTHEINNPVNFIYGNLSYAHNYIRDLLKVVKAYQEEYPQSSSHLDSLIKEVELDFLVEDLDKLMVSMQFGVERIAKIMRGLRSFSRLDEAELKKVDIHEGLENTIMMLQYRLGATDHRPEIEVIRNYHELPEVTCFPGDLNQVFFHILKNAIDAMENESHPRIEIATFLTGSDWVTILIKNNGSAIDGEIKERVFDPFFTTKTVGQGVGLGLAISHQIIVEKHQGKLLLNSTENNEVEFTVQIPIEHK